MNQSTNASESSWDALSKSVGVITDRQTYKNLLYLLLAFPLGLIYYIILTVGFTVGIALSILVVGLGILFVTVLGVRFIASFERTLANTLLGTEITKPNDVRIEGEGIVNNAKAYLRAPSTWRGLGFVALKFWVGVLSFVLLVSFLGTAIELLLIPLFPGGAFNIEVANWVVAESIQTTTEQVIAAPAGAILALFALHILNAFARASASIASSLLGQE